MLRRAAFICFILCISLFSMINAQTPGPESQLDPKPYDPAVDPNIDLFIGNWRDSSPRVLFGTIVVRDILTRCTGDPLHPTKKGAVLTEANAISYATLKAKTTAKSTPLKGEQIVIYIYSGKGTITSAGKTSELRRGNNFVAAPGFDFVLTNTGNDSMTMYMITEPIKEGAKPLTELIIKDEYASPARMSVHWSNIDRSITGRTSGMVVFGGLTGVSMDAMTIGQPASHTLGTEECWIAVEGDIYCILGKQIRKLPVGSAYRIPWNGMTAHGNINFSDKPIKMIHMMNSVPGKVLPFSQLDGRQFDPARDADIDQFMGKWEDSQPHILYGSLIVRDMLTKSTGTDPLHPVRKGAALTDLISVSYAAMEPFASTTPATLKAEQNIVYYNSGKGTIKAGNQTVELRKGIWALIPAGIEFSIQNTGVEPLTLYFISEPVTPGFVPKKEIVVKDESAPGLNLTIHWSDMPKGLFGPGDLCILRGIGPIVLDPMTISQPHSHEAGVEEVFVGLSGDIQILLGKQLRNLPAGTAYRVPSTGNTPYANINHSNAPVKLIWMMNSPLKAN